jgi:hypothetical protein
VRGVGEHGYQLADGRVMHDRHECRHLWWQDLFREVVRSPSRERVERDAGVALSTIQSVGFVAVA